MQFWKKSTAKSYSPEDRKNLKKAYSRILWFLSKRDYSIKELTTKLHPYFDEDTTQAAIDKANAAGWLKPPEEIAQQVYKRLNGREKGHFFIANELKKLGLPPIPQNEELELEKAFSLVEKKFFKLFQAIEANSANKDNSNNLSYNCLLYTSPSPRDQRGSRMPSSA